MSDSYPSFKPQGPDNETWRDVTAPSPWSPPPPSGPWGYPGPPAVFGPGGPAQPTPTDTWNYPGRTITPDILPGGGGWPPAAPPPPTVPVRYGYGSWAPQPSPPAPPGGGRAVVAVIAIVIAGLLGTAIGAGLLGRRSPAQTATPPVTQGPLPTSVSTVPPTTAGTVPARRGAAAMPTATIAAVVNPGLVDVNTRLEYQHAAAAGTGMIISSSGQILTNNHVVLGATSITVTAIATGKAYTATVVGTDPTEDVAVLQVHAAPALQPVKLGDSSTVVPGDSVVAIGNAGGTGGAPSVVTGTVGALAQSITASQDGGIGAEQLDGLIETDAPLQPGDSGGPLVNGSAEVVGMNTAASGPARVESQVRLSFAIPINHALAIAKEIEAGHAGTTIHIGTPGFLGVQVQSASPSGSGAIVAAIEPGTPAAAARLTRGDVITAVDGQPITPTQTLTSVMQRHHPGDKVTVAWTDHFGRSRAATVTLIVGPAD